MSSPFFSVIIPTFNRAHVLSRAIDSVLEQSFDDWELLIIDDGSTDDTQALLSNYKDNEKVHLLHTSNQGVSKARNLAATKARGQWLAFLDSDDEWLSNKLRLQWEEIQKSGCKLVHGEEIWIRNGVRVNQMKKHQKGGGDQFFASLKLCAISPSTAVMEKNTFFELGGFREDFPVCEDYDLWLKHTSLYPVAYITEPIIKKYGGHEDQLSAKYKAMDHWRILSMSWILKNRKLSEEQKEALLETLSKKIEILIKGYRKHERYEDLAEIEKLRDELF